ncbi:MAG: hypothetical protein BWY77_01477 [bacterium ADurb.Bin431]|jgi:hypothetical protein|nr:MAG: hypothetical protein BWY77_01477 [bacterium ADurb.Bin431]
MAGTRPVKNNMENQAGMIKLTERAEKALLKAAEKGPRLYQVVIAGFG